MCRSKIETLFAIHPDTDGGRIYRIISKKNGGVDHTENYDTGRDRTTWARVFGDEHDHINCFLAGRERCQKAVDISRSLGGYAGPGAETLYALGEKTMRYVLDHFK